MENTNFAKLHPGLGLVYYILVLCLVILVQHPIELLILYISVIASLMYRDYLVGNYIIKKSWKFYLIPFLMAIIMGLINSLFRHYGSIYLFRFSNGNYYTLDSLIDGAQGGFRLGLCVLWLKHFEKHMSSNKVIYIFKPLMPRFSLFLTLTLRFFPHYLEQSKEIVMVNRLSKDNKNLNFVQKIENNGQLITKLSSWALESSIDTARYMQARGYGLSKRKTSYQLYSWNNKDSLVMLLIIVASLLYFYLQNKGVLEFIFYPILYVPEWQALNFASLGLLGFISFLPLFLDLKDY